MTVREPEKEEKTKDANDANGNDTKENEGYKRYRNDADDVKRMFKYKNSSLFYIFYFSSSS